MTKICILQPSYIPWKGYFHQIQQSDVFVFFDTVQYDRRGWRNRNKIKTPRGPAWLTIPVHARGSHDGLLIKDVQVRDSGWAQAHLTRLRQQYQSAPCFSVEFPWIEEMLLDLSERYAEIGKIAAESTRTIAERLGLGTRFVYASDLDVGSADPSERLLKMVQALEGGVYLSGPSAQNYLDTGLFDAAGVDVTWMTYDYPEYPQLYPPFTHEVSILDLIFMVGCDQAGRYIWDK